MSKADHICNAIHEPTGTRCGHFASHAGRTSHEGHGTWPSTGREGWIRWWDPGQTATFTYHRDEPITVTVLGPYRAPGSMPDEWVIERADGVKLAVRGRDLS